MKKKFLFVFLIVFLVFLAACSPREQTSETEPVVVRFVTDGTKVSAVVDQLIEAEPLSTKEGFVLEGWYQDKQYEKRIAFPFRAHESCTLYAKWIDKNVGNEELVFVKRSDDTLEVTSCDTVCSTIWIPDQKNGKIITSLAFNFIKNKTHLTFIHIGKNVNSIGETFSRCLRLQEIEVEEGNESWTSEEGVLYSADKSLLYAYPVAKEEKTFSVPDSVTELGANAFSFNVFLQELSLGKSVVVNPSKLKNMESLQKFIVDEENETISSKDGVLYSVDGKQLLIFPACYAEKTFSIAPGTEEVAENAFYRCNLTSINLNKELSVFNAPTSAPALTAYTVEEGNAYFVSRDGVLFIDEGKTLYRFPLGKSGEYAIPSNTEVVFDFAFSYSAVEKVSFPATVTTIERFAFSECQSLTEISFAEDSKLERMDGSAFSRCFSLKKASLTSRVPPQTDSGLFSSHAENFTVVIPAYTDGLYKAKWPFLTDAFSATGAAVIQYDLIFEAQGGTPVPAVRAAYLLEEPKTTRESESANNYYIFLGWYDNPEGTGNKIEFPYAIEEDTTLYAAWDIGFYTKPNP